MVNEIPGICLTHGSSLGNELDGGFVSSKRSYERKTMLREEDKEFSFGHMFFGH